MKWTMPALLREIESTRANFSMAQDEIAAGNRRLKPHLEQWAIKLDTLECERQQLLKNSRT